MFIYFFEKKDAEIFDFVDLEDIFNLFIKSLVWWNLDMLIDSDGEFSEEVEDYFWEELEFFDDLYEFWRVFFILFISFDYLLNVEYFDEVFKDKEVFRCDFNWFKFLYEEWREDMFEVY